MKRIIIDISILIVLVVLVSIGSGRIESIDGQMYLETAKSLVYHGRFFIEEKMPGLAPGIDGNRYSVGGLGWTMMLAIPIWLNKILGGGIDNAGFWGSFVNPFLASLLFLVLMNLYSLFIKNRRTVLLLSLIILFSTNLLPLSKHGFAHMMNILLLVLTVYLGILYGKLRKYWLIVLLGITSGWYMLSYNYSFIVPAMILLSSVLLNWRNLNLDMKVIWFWFIGFMPWLIVLFVYNYLRFGNMFESGYSYNLSAGDFRFKPVFVDGLWGLMLSPGRSFWVFNPIMLLAIWMSIKRYFQDWTTKLFLWLLVITVLFFARLTIWHAELSYGPRYLSFLVPFGGLVLAKNWNRVNKVWLAWLTVIGLWVQIVGVLVPYDKQYPWYDMEFMCVGAQGLSRKGELDYWNIGEFIPRFSPPYRLKKIVFSEKPDFWWINK